MPGAGTDKTKRWIERPAPIVVLVEPQLGENIGAAARAMANFGLSRLRLVKPVQGWPNEKARVMAAGADRVLEGAQLYDSLADAIGDCTFVLAATARNHDQAKPVIGAAEAAAEMAPRVAAGENVAVVFGRERNGLENYEVGASRPHPDAAGQSGLCLAQSGAGGGHRRLRMVQAGGWGIAIRHAGEVAAGRQAAARGLLRRSRARARQGRVFPPGGKARHHGRQFAQHFPAHGAHRSRTCARCTA